MLAALTFLDLIFFIIYTKFFFKYASYSIDYRAKNTDSAVDYGTLEITVQPEPSTLGSEEPETSSVDVWILCKFQGSHSTGKTENGEK